MRVTHQVIKNTVIRNVQRNLHNMNRYQDMLSSGKTVTKPSDNPIKVARIMGYNTALDKNEQYQKNIDAARSWVDTTEDALYGITEVLQRSRELAVAGANDVLSPEARRAAAMEVDELIGVLVQIGNSTYEDRHIFSGYRTTTVPFERTDDPAAGPAGITYAGDDGSIGWEVAPNVTIRGNVTGDDLFLDSGVFAEMEKLMNGLYDDDGAALTESIDALQQTTDYVLDRRSALGAIRNGLDLSTDNLTSQKINFSRLRSQLEDIDFPETMMNFSVMDTLYQASLMAGARIMQPSLMDFLR
ncbi:flagellar hook-associated protein FlgL [Dethiobacter alkaliphilus]|uniref:flagellar hook-associated protein FlgL n=1 Tax=Dethiobacter alkaliphilus TaxID=427926 RepID=UPI002226D28B|nr:flagellar hook-associated protein FlgL [Dethiobacter alkaliphilus]MCW3488758.1 flagellar hook-associated protein FlgL [Dethiobacter alkaliphilus]